jgi:hypothetical protein
VRGYGGDLGETLGAGAALNRAGLGLDVRVRADAVRSGRLAGLRLGSEPGSGRRWSRHTGPACQRAEERGEEADWAGGACCAHGILGQGEAPRPRKREGVGDGAGAHGLSGKGSGPWKTRAERGERRRWAAGEVLAREGMKGRQEQAGLREKEARATGLFLFLLFFSFSFLHSNYSNNSISIQINLNSNPIHSTQIKQCFSMNAQIS